MYPLAEEMCCRVGASYIKSRRKRIFVLTLLFSFLFTWIGYAFLGGGVYVIGVTLLSSLLFEVVSVFLYGLLSKRLLVMKLV